MQGNSGVRVLLVEDDQGIGETSVDVLEHEGYVVRWATSGVAGLEELKSGFAPCLIFLDLMMPNMDGWAFAKQKDSDPKLVDIPVVVMSAIATTRFLPPAIRPVDHLIKPFSADDLLAMVKRHC